MILSFLKFRFCLLCNNLGETPCALFCGLLCLAWRNSFTAPKILSSFFKRPLSHASIGA